MYLALQFFQFSEQQPFEDKFPGVDENVGECVGEYVGDQVGEKVGESVGAAEVGEAVG